MRKTWWQSNQAFGVVFSAFLFIICARKYFKLHYISWPLLVLAMIFLLFALLAPEKLASLNKIWMQFGTFLSKLTTPIVMGVLFFVAFTGTSLILKIFRINIMPLKANPKVKSYWILRSNQEQIKKNLPFQF